MAALRPVAGVAVLALRPAIPPRIIGMVRTTEIKIEPEVSGRIEAVGKELRGMMSWIRDARKDSSDPNAR